MTNGEHNEKEISKALAVGKQLVSIPVQNHY